MDKTQYTTIYLVRHGETDWNVKGIVQGHSDIPLNNNGEKQAVKLSQDFKDIFFDGVFSSDLLRAHKTAQLAVLEKKIAVQTTEILRERFFGEMEGKHRDEFLKREALQKNLTKEEKLVHRLVPGMETSEKVIERMITFLREIAVGYIGKTVLVVSHGAVMRILLEHLGYFTDEHPIEKIENTAYIKLLCDGVDFFIDQTKGIERK